MPYVNWLLQCVLTHVIVDESTLLMVLANRISVPSNTPVLQFNYWFQIESNTHKFNISHLGGQLLWIVIYGTYGIEKRLKINIHWTLGKEAE